MIRQMIKVMVCALPVCLLALNACDSGSQDLEGMLKSMRDACVEKDGYFQADADYQCTCNGMPLGNMEICLNQTTPMECSPNTVIKDCVTVFNKEDNSFSNQWRYCRYGFWEYGEASAGEICKLCDSTYAPSCGKLDDKTFGVTSCVGGVWEFKPCENGCADDKLSCADCKKDDKRCDNDETTLLFCVDGAYKSKKCQGKCVNGECAPVCKKNEKRCDNDNKYLRVCNDGEWENVPCGFGCEDNECVVPEDWDDSCTGEYECENIPGLGYGYKMKCEQGRKKPILEPCREDKIVSCASKTLCGECRSGISYCSGETYSECKNGLWEHTSPSDKCLRE